MQSKAIEKSNQHAKLCKQLISRSIWAHFQWPLRLNSKFILMSVMSVMSVMSEYQKDWWDTPNRPKRFFFFSVGFSILITITINTARHRISPLRQAVCHFQGRLSAENGAQHADMVIYQQPNATNHRLINSWVQQTTPWPKTVRLFRGTQR